MDHLEKQVQNKNHGNAANYFATSVLVSSSIISQRTIDFVDRERVGIPYDSVDLPLGPILAGSILEHRRNWDGIIRDLT